MPTFLYKDVIKDIIFDLRLGEMALRRFHQNIPIGKKRMTLCPLDLPHIITLIPVIYKNNLQKHLQHILHEFKVSLICIQP